MKKGCKYCYTCVSPDFVNKVDIHKKVLFQKNIHGFSKSISTAGRPAVEKNPPKFRPDGRPAVENEKVIFFQKIKKIFFSLKDMIKRILLMTFSDYL